MEDNIKIKGAKTHPDTIPSKNSGSYGAGNLKKYAR